MPWWVLVPGRAKWIAALVALVRLMDGGAARLVLVVVRYPVTRWCLNLDEFINAGRGRAGLRWGELMVPPKVRRRPGRTNRPVPRRLVQLNSGKFVEDPPQSAAGFRTVAMPVRGPSIR